MEAVVWFDKEWFLWALPIILSAVISPFISWALDRIRGT